MSEENSYFDKIEQLLDKTGLLSTEDRHLINEIHREGEIAADKGVLGADFLEEEEEEETKEEETEAKEAKDELESSLQRKEPTKDHQVFLTISPDYLEANITIIPHEGFSIDRETVERMLVRRGIRSGIMWEEIENCIRRANSGMMVTGDIIARGKPPVDGQDAIVHYYFELEKKEYGLTRRQKKKQNRPKVSYCVRKGQMIAEKIPLVRGVSGLDLKARLIPTEKVEDSPLVPGKNTSLDEHGRLFSLVEGKPRVDVTGMVTVVPIFSVDGDLDLSVGNIKFAGDVEILGNVMPGFVIDAEGDVTVNGGVDGSRIFSKGSINIKGGFAGGKRGLLKAGGDCHISHCNTGMIEVTGDLFVDKEILNATVYTSGQLKFQGKGALIGGQVFVGKNLEVHNVGSNFGVSTQIFMGQKELIQRRLKKVFAKKREREKQIDLIQRSIHRLKLQADSMTINVELHKKILMELVEGQNAFHKDLEQIHEEIKELNDMKSRFTVHFVRIKGSIFPGARISIGESNLDIEKRANRREYYEDPTHRAIMYRSYTGSSAI